MTCVLEDIGIGARRSDARNLARGKRFLRTPGEYAINTRTPDGVRGIRASLWDADVTRFQQPEVALATLAYLRLMSCHASGVRVPG